MNEDYRADALEEASGVPIPEPDSSSDIPVSEEAPEQDADALLSHAADDESASLTEETLPPEARGEANGGPLGCCLGVTVGLFLSLSIALFARFYGDSLSTSLLANIRLIMAVTAIVAALICGYIGWRIGSRVYREYEMNPRQRERLTRLERKYQRK